MPGSFSYNNVLFGGGNHVNCFVYGFSFFRWFGWQHAGRYVEKISVLK